MSDEIDPPLTPDELAQGEVNRHAPLRPEHLVDIRRALMSDTPDEMVHLHACMLLREVIRLQGEHAAGVAEERERVVRIIRDMLSRRGRRVTIGDSLHRGRRPLSTLRRPTQYAKRGSLRGMTHAPETAARLRTLADLLDRGAVVECTVTWRAGEVATILAYDPSGAPVAVADPTNPPDPGKV